MRFDAYQKGTDWVLSFTIAGVQQTIMNLPEDITTNLQATSEYCEGRADAGQQMAKQAQEDAEARVKEATEQADAKVKKANEQADERVAQAEAQAESRIAEIRAESDRIKAMLKKVVAEWSPDGVKYEAGDYVQYKGVVYEVIQPHTSQADWAPDVAESLFKIPVPEGTVSPWVQPQGAHDAYKKGDLVEWTDGKIYRSKIDANVWSPAEKDYWELVE